MADDAIATQPGPRAVELLLVCLRCARKLDAVTEDGRTILRQALRARIAADNAPLRVVETSCLGLCPEGAITAALGRDLGGERPQFYTVAAGDDGAALYRHVRTRVANPDDVGVAACSTPAGAARPSDDGRPAAGGADQGAAPTASR